MTAAARHDLAPKLAGEQRFPLMDDALAVKAPLAAGGGNAPYGAPRVPWHHPRSGSG